MNIFKKILSERHTEHFACGPKRDKNELDYISENELIGDAIRVKNFSPFKSIFKIGFLLGIFSFVCVGLFILYAYIRLPDIHSMINQTRPASVVFVDKDGYELRAMNKIMGESVDVATLPPYVWQSIVATEDKRFFKHGAVDLYGVVRSAVVNLVSNNYKQGGSSITQQLAKNLFLSRSKTLTRKVQEVLIAYWLESVFTKNQILNLYTNRVSLSRGLRGIDSASRDIFGVRASELSLSESARLTAMLKAPTTYNPLNNFEKSSARAKIVLNAMLKEKYISESDYNKAILDLLKPIYKRPDSNVHRYFTDYVYDDLISRIGKIPDTDVIVWTTLDSKMQRKIDSVINNKIKESKDKNVSQSAVVAMNKNGAISAMVGGVDYQKSQFNRVLALRQPGSLFKVLVYLLAFENGYNPDDLVIDEPYSVEDYSPRNYNNKYYGEIKLKEAFARSVNSVPLKLAEEFGIGKVLKMAARFGVGTDIKREYATILGSSEMTLLDLTKMYAILANHGYDVRPYAIEKVMTEDGKIIYENISEKKDKIYDESVDKNVSLLLGEVVNAPYGTGKRAKVDGILGGKTGTSTDNRDAWFVGFTNDLVMGVWVGNDSNEPMNNITGGGLPAMIFSDILMN